MNRIRMAQFVCFVFAFLLFHLQTTLISTKKMFYAFKKNSWYNNRTISAFVLINPKHNFRMETN